MTRLAPFLIIATVTVVTLGAGVVFYRANRIQVASQSQQQRDDGETVGVHAVGSKNAPVTLEEFGDFQCPPCGGLAEPLDEIMKQYHKQVRFIFREHPLNNHAFAMPATIAAEAAGLQGKFWEMHDLLYRNQAIWSKAPDAREFFLAYAKSLGLDFARFKKDIMGPEVKARIADDLKRGNELGVTLTPTVFINGVALTGPSTNPTSIREAVKAALATPVEKK